ncbi:TetR/AcrR family transcriptional regulator [Mycolicibacterium hodleri]|uniref:TetR/AcrR family transcriptional regulator n=1 Tax=Mycolicibacterium hodleri TaxID=49897 RepID=A0A502EFW0_9MYCO|nr:TetR/AcrR family transcriptional regulator [Mycolicibacterium hodleri]TPG36613.1 TetR/AcrR family transcriptional regulator [Mycolicibacterium hodleri]
MYVAHFRSDMRRPNAPLAMLGHETRSPVHGRAAERILRAATEAVADRGLDGLSMEDVALRAGCSRATVYRRVGGKEALRDAVLDQAIDRITAAVAHAVDHLDGDERVAHTIVASLDIIRTDAVSAALLTGPATGESVDSALITRFNDVAAELAGLDPSDAIGCELITRVTLSLLCWPAADRRTELAVIRRYVVNGRSETARPGP